MCYNCITFISDERFELAKSTQDNIIQKFDIEKVFDTYSKQLYEDRIIDDETKKKLFHSVYQPLKEAVKEGVGQVTAKIEYGTPNFELLKNLQHNVGVFSAFKNHSMVKEIVALLKDENGDLKPFQQFKNDALLIDAKYRQQWLKVEYDTAVRQARMAAQWERIQRTKHLYPNLEYIHTKAAHPRNDHLAYVGIIRPVDDPFWFTHYPSNGYGCECSVRQTDKDITDVPNDLPAIPKQFAFNAGKTGQALDVKNGEYIKTASASEIPKLIKLAKTEVNKDIINDLEYQTIYESKKGGGKVEVHPLAVNNSDFNEVLNAARSLANNGKKIKILPDVTDVELRKLLLPAVGVKGLKNPDYLIDGVNVTDLKTLNSSSSKAVQNALKSCNDQCDNIVLVVADNNPINYNDLLKWIKGKVKYDNYKNFNNIWINMDGKWNYLTREIILNYDFSYKSK